MNEVIGRILGAVRLGEPSSVGTVTLVPVFTSLAQGPEYVTLAEALEAGTLSVTELDSDGSVPELRARNSGRTGVLVIDGEELRGAKQNRVLNTSVYLPPGSEIVIPVSCVEAGRWRAESPSFVDSGYVSAARVRCATRESVTHNVRACGDYASNQGRVWNAVDDFAADHGVVSATRAMRDVFERRRAAVEPFVDRVALEPQQCGLLAVIGGCVVGVDVVSRPEAYRILHPRLVRSYAYDSREVAALGTGTSDDLKLAKRFLVSLADLEVTSHRSPGSGIAHRFTGSAAVGDALTYRGAVLHAAFFAAQGDEVRDDRMASAACRRGFRV